MNNKLKHFLWVNKEGALVGTAVALVLWFMGWNSFLPITNTYLNLVTLVIIFGGIGGAIDAFWKPNK